MSTPGHTEPPHSENPEPAGLTAVQAAERRARFGPNSVAQPRSLPIRAFLRKLNGPVPWMLEGALVLEIVQGKAVEAAIVGVLLLFNAALSFVQEHRAQAALELLRTRLKLMARVQRDGTWQALPAESLVPDDLVHVGLGDFVPADLRVVTGAALLDQSALTGEAAPVEVESGGLAYAGGVVRRGQATGIVTATGSRSYFGRTAELVRVAHSASHLEELIRGIVMYLVALDAAVATLVLVDALVRAMPVVEVLPFVLMLLVASVPVALPATFTLASALGALELAGKGVLVTRLSAIEEAAAMQVVCSDKTGTLTENKLTVVAVEPRPPFDGKQLLELAALACDEKGQDPLDLAILAAQQGAPPLDGATRVSFLPFDPATKRAEAVVRTADGLLTVTKGAPQAIAALVGTDVSAAVSSLAEAGARVLAVAVGPERRLALAGLLGFRDPPRDGSKEVVRTLHDMGVRVVMVTGDAAPTAAVVAKELEIGATVCGRDRAREPTGCDVFAGVLPEDKFELVRAFQQSKLVVGMTGDGVNDAPALKQAEVGIAVSRAVDVAKAAASIVLTRPGLGGVLASVETGRRIYQRMLTYTLNKIVKTIEIALFLGIGFFLTGAMVVTPRQILLLLFTNDFVTMSIASDRATFSRKPERWNVRALIVAGLALAGGWLAFSLAVLGTARWGMHLPLVKVQTVAFLVLVLGGQANVYLVRERSHFWRSRPGGWLVLASMLDLLFVAVLVMRGWLMAPLDPEVVGVLAIAVLLFLALLDAIKVRVLRG